MLMTILIVILILMILGAVPRQGSYNAGWGYGPSGLIGVILVVILILALMGRL